MSDFGLRELAAALAAVGLWACGGEGKPAETPAAGEGPAAQDTAAVDHDLYEGFDGGGFEDEPPAEEPATSSNDQAGAACHRVAAAWEQRARPQIKACYREGKKRDPNLMGTARIIAAVGSDGKIKPAKLDGTSSLGDDVAACMVKAVSATEFTDAEPCRGRQLTVPIEFPTPVKPK